MAPTRKNKKDKKSRNSRKNRKDSRKNRRCGWRKQAGGNMAQSLGQGREYMEYHKNQHGGAYLTGAPLSQIDGSMLESGLREFARVGGLDASIAAAATQRDPDQITQNGGRRTGRKNKKSKSKSKSKKSKKNRKASKKSKKSRSRRQQGGALTGAPINAPTMLISQAAAARAGTADFSNALLKN
jgi:hypothetical protein